MSRSRSKNQPIVESDEETVEYFESEPKGHQVDLVYPGTPERFKPKVDIVYDDDTTVNMCKIKVLTEHYPVDINGAKVDPKDYQLALEDLTAGNTLLVDHEYMMSYHGKITACSRLLIQCRGVPQPQPPPIHQTLNIMYKH